MKEYQIRTNLIALSENKEELKNKHAKKTP